MNRILAICNTPVQIMFTINLKNTIYAGCEMDIIFTDTLNGYKKLVGNSNKYNVFNHAYTADTFEFTRRIGKFAVKNPIDKLIRLSRRTKIVKEIIDIKKSYNILLFNNIDDFSNGIYECLYKNNKDIKTYLIEDGYSTYCVQGDVILKAIEKHKKIFNRLIYRLLNKRAVVMNIDGQFLYDCDGIGWKAYFERFPVNKFNKNNKTMINELNFLFDYKSMIDTYDTPIIFFEESYRTEGININDVQIVEMIATWVGKESIMIKIHPRNKDNIYKSLGYKTNINTEIPWELIFMNDGKMKEKLLISVASGSIATPYTMLGEGVKSIALLNMEQINPTDFLPAYYEYLNKNVFEKNQQIFKRPNNSQELKDAVFMFLEKGGQI
ncbi:polysialyltransferase family glycosyltransferase [Clostridium chromiireducens]|uniref:polysialyltransferase family glycosyltransferase n=1 Tax=Clostridium chromiireducens TaxID=225345 RepID=UPI003AF51992